MDPNGDVECVVVLRARFQANALEGPRTVDSADFVFKCLSAELLAMKRTETAIKCAFVDSFSAHNFDFTDGVAMTGGHSEEDAESAVGVAGEHFDDG